MSERNEATTQHLVWFRVRADKRTVLEMMEWQLHSEVLPAVGASSGPINKDRMFYTAGFLEEDAQRLRAWLQDHHVELKPRT